MNLSIGNFYENRDGQQCEIVGQWGQFFLALTQGGPLWDNKLNLCKTLHAQDGRCLGSGHGYDILREIPKDEYTKKAYEKYESEKRGQKIISDLSKAAYL